MKGRPLFHVFKYFNLHVMIFWSISTIIITFGQTCLKQPLRLWDICYDFNKTNTLAGLQGSQLLSLLCFWKASVQFFYMLIYSSETKYELWNKKKNSRSMCPLKLLQGNWHSQNWWEFKEKTQKHCNHFFSTKDSNIFPRQQLLVDPTDKEEIVMNGRMIMAMNIHREICGAVMGGGVSLESEQVHWLWLIPVFSRSAGS